MAQDDPVSCTDSAYCIPGVIGMAPPKGLVIEHETLTDFSINARSSVGYIQDAPRQVVNYNRRFLAKLRLPVLSKDHLKVIVGGEYFEESYQFADSESLQHPLYQVLQTRKLRSVGSRVYVSRLFLGNKFLFIRGAANLNGDFANRKGAPLHYFLRASVSALYGWKSSKYTSIGVGLGFSYNFGRPLPFPIFTYMHSWENGLGVEISLPTKAQLRYSVTPKSILYLTTELNGGSYRLNLPNTAFSERAETFELRKSEVRTHLRFEQEIYDFIWIGMETGIRSNLNFNLSERNAISRRDEVLRSRVNHALLFNLSVFLVPPRKFRGK